MREPYQWYILYVRSNAEKRVVDDFNRFVAAHAFDDEFEPFCPQTEVYFRSKKGQAERTYRKRPLFPGYVFVETTMPPADFLRELGSYIYGSDDIIRVLRCGNSDNIALPDDERKRLEFLLKGKRCLDRSIGYIVGEKVCVTDGPLRGMEGLIKYINRHNRYAEIEVDMFGGKVKASVALEIVQKTD